MDEMGIEKQVVFPSLWLGCLAEDVGLEVALVRSYNQFMATQCNRSGGRLSYVAVLPFRHPEIAAEEVRRVRQMGGAVGLFIRGMEWDLPVTHPMLWPIYEEAERQDLVMALHIGFGSPTICRMFEGLPRERPANQLPFVHPLGQGLLSGHLSKYALECVFRSTLMEDFPRLRWVILETGSEWVPPVVWSHSRRRGEDLSRYFREGRICMSAEPEENIAMVVDALGEECLVVASDMPHGDAFHHDEPEAAWRERTDLSDRLRTKLLRENTLSLYRM
jgi:predicted TIM-barrel fold metal-dependent hydrolase